jgi:SH3-like domain-containing protein
LLVAALAGGTLLYGFQQRNLPVAVVAETGTVLKRIPEQRARDWLRLPSGTTVRVAATHQGWLLVETAFGGKGWVERSAVYLAEDRTAL